MKEIIAGFNLLWLILQITGFFSQQNDLNNQRLLEENAKPVVQKHKHRRHA
jgi:hypothetical protein